MNDRTPMEKVALALYYHAAQLIKAGKSAEEIEQDLVQHGVSPQTARLMLERLEASRVNVTHQAGWRNLFFGGVLVVAGVILILGLFNLNPEDWKRLIGWGLALLGLIWMIHGLRQIRVV